MQQQTKYDVGIIGGGLAGLALSIQCAQAGLSAILFEKERYPFHKVCGEYISLESWNFLASLGVPLQEMALPVIKTLELTDVRGRGYKFALPLGGFGISRYKLDHCLYHIAVAKSVTVMTGCKVQDVSYDDGNHLIKTDSGTFETTIAAGSYGKRSNLDIRWSRPFATQKPDALNNFIGIKYHINFPHATDLISLHNFRDGYCGISSIEDGKSCLCYLTTAGNLKQNGNSIKEMEANVLFQNPRLRDIFQSADFLYRQPLAISQVSFAKKSKVQDHVLMLGDAAGMISPLCGNGMSIALHTSKLAFEQVKLFLGKTIRREEMEARYQSGWKAKFSKRLLVGRTVQRLFGGNRTTGFFLKTMSGMPAIARKLIEATHGEPF